MYVKFFGEFVEEVCKFVDVYYPEEGGENPALGDASSEGFRRREKRAVGGE